MANVAWATPREIGRLTIPQLVALGSERPPGQKKISSAADLARWAEAKRREEEAWSQ